MITSKRWFILAGIIALSALFTGCGGGGGSGSGVPVSGNSLSGSVVLPADTASTMTVSLLADAKYASLTIHLFDLSEKDIVSPSALSSSGEFYFSNVPAGNNYKLVVVTPGGKKLLRKHIDSFSETKPAITVNTETTALAILVQKNGYAKSEAALAAEIPQADLAKVAEKVTDWLKGIVTSSEADVSAAITEIVGEQELLKIVNYATGEISGTVILSIGGLHQPMSGLAVSVNGTSYFGLSNAMGNFTIHNVPSNAFNSEAAYEILVNSSKGSTLPVTGVVVNPGLTTDIGTIIITALPQTSYVILDGSLISENAVSRVGGLLVLLVSSSDGSLFATYTDINGNYRFAVMETGQFSISCAEKGYDFTPNPIQLKINDLDNSVITLSPITVSCTPDNTIVELPENNQSFER